MKLPALRSLPTFVAVLVPFQTVTALPARSCRSSLLIFQEPPYVVAVTGMDAVYFPVAACVMVKLRAMPAPSR